MTRGRRVLMGLGTAFLAAVGCRQLSTGELGADSSEVTRAQLDGAYAPVSNSEVTIVFRLRPQSSRDDSTFFAEYPGADGETRRVEGIFSHDYDDQGATITLEPNGAPAPRAGDAAAQEDEDAGEEVDAQTAEPVTDAGGTTGTVDAGGSIGTPGGDGGASPGGDAGARRDAGGGSSEPIPPLLSGTFHFVKTGGRGTVVVRGPTGKTVQFKKIASYCGIGAAKDCADPYQSLGKTCDTGWTCSETHTCECPSGTGAKHR